MRRVVYLALVIIVGVLLIVFFNDRQESEETTLTELPPPNVLELSTLLAYSNSLAPAAHVEIQRDVFPGGLMAAMVPGLVDWQRTQVADGQGEVILRNVNDGGNPLGGFTILRTLAIPLESLQGAEFVLVPLDALGRHGIVSHGQIRFLFDPANPIQVLDEDGNPDPAQPPVTDLVFSWEAWRGPGVDFDVMTGMDTGNYELSLRVYTGRQRFLEDALSQRDWYSSPLNLPGGKRGVLELFRVCVVMGDGMGRSTIGGLLDEAKESWMLAGGPLQAGADELLAEWHELREKADYRVEVDDPKLQLEQGVLSYQSLIRSCATMALYTINVAVQRLQEEQVHGAEKVQVVPMPAIEEIPDWMREMAHVDLKGIFVRAPTALGFIRKNKAVIPTNIPGMLNEANLVVQNGGKPVQNHYSLSKGTPYGTSGLIR